MVNSHMDVPAAIEAQLKQEAHKVHTGDIPEHPAQMARETMPQGTLYIRPPCQDQEMHYSQST